MSQRISLTRVIALGWYGFRQIIDVKDNVLISGAFGTGKSALLDLVQYVLLGEHWRANRAAAGNARGRDLVSYCLGDTNQMRDGQRHFLRQSGVTIVALEFTRAEDKSGKAPKRETWGIRLQYSSPDAAPKQTYFCIPERVEYASLISDGELLSDDAFRAWLRREYGNDSLFARQKDYLEELAAPRHLNFDADAFHRTFPKAIAFEPEENVERFIREFILEENPLDVRDVRNALHAYDDTRKRLEKQEDEAGFLRRIAGQHQLYTTSKRTEAILKHTHQSLLLLQAEERRDEAREELKRLEKDHADDLRKLAKEMEAAAEIDRLLKEVRFKVSQDPEQAKFEEWSRRGQELTARVHVLREAQKSLQQRLDDRHYRWKNWLKHGDSLSVRGLDEVLKVDDGLLATLRSGTDAERLEAMQKLSDQFNDIWRGVERLLHPLQTEIKTSQGRLQELAKDLENLSKGQTPGSFPLFTSLRQKLGNRVEQLGRLIEVKPEAERWWPALELYLGRNRWVLVVEKPADYREALDILQKVPTGREAESLLNPAEVRQARGNPVASSLFSKIEVTHPVAKAYLEQLLGDVQCVETVEELESCAAGRAITAEGIFKQVPLRRRLKPAGSVELTLGREGLERMRKTKLKEQQGTRTDMEGMQQQLQDVQAWLETGKQGELGNSKLPDLAAELPQLANLEKELAHVRSTIQLLQTPERAERQKQLEELDNKNKVALESVGRLKTRNGDFEVQAKPLRERADRYEQETKQYLLNVETSRVELSKQVSGLLQKDLNAKRDRYRQEHSHWQECFEAINADIRQAEVKAVAAKADRKAERERLSKERDEQGHLKHPEYQHDFAIEDESNEAWDNRLRVLETIELEKSRELAADRKKEWERRLEENVLNELNRRIEQAKNTIRLLDRYLSQPVGKYCYRLSQRKDTAGYGAIWQLLDSGLEANDPLMGAIKDQEVQRAKEELMQAVNASDKGDDRARRLLDYRNYHHYDLEMVPADRPDAPPISLGKSGRNLSGGENQAPFFISMLAAFRRVYDRGDRNSTRSQQLGLVLMDEAFSKLSGDGIEDCLGLANNFQLQLIMAFPPERLGVMVPHAQTVIMCQKELKRDKDGYVTGIENIPLLTTMAEAMDALA